MTLQAQALQTIILAWDPNVETNLTGYKLYYGTASRIYPNILDVGGVTTGSVSNLVEGITYYFAITAYNNLGLQSDFSDEIVYTVPDRSNVPPTLGALSDLTLTEDSGTQTVRLLGISAGATSEIQTLTVTATSSNPGLIPNPIVTYTSPNITGTLSLTPVANASGSATITVTVSDGLMTTTTSLLITVLSVNDPTTTSTIPDFSINEDSPGLAVAFSIADVDTPIEALSIWAACSDSSLIPPGNILLTGTGADRAVTLRPLTNQFGTAVITLTLSDGTQTNASSFTVRVNPVNDAPTLSQVPGQTISKQRPALDIPFTVGDVETPAGNLVLSAISSNPNLIASDNIIFGGSGSNRTVTLLSTRGRTGTALITIFVSDGGLRASNVFLVTVTGTPLSLVGSGATAPRILSINSSLSGGALVSWTSTAGSIYRVLSKNTVNDANWTYLSTNIAASTTITSWVDPGARSVSSRFYKVQLLR